MDKFIKNNWLVEKYVGKSVLKSIVDVCCALPQDGCLYDNLFVAVLKEARRRCAQTSTLDEKAYWHRQRMKYRFKMRRMKAQEFTDAILSACATCASRAASK